MDLRKSTLMREHQIKLDRAVNHPFALSLSKSPLKHPLKHSTEKWRMEDFEVGQQIGSGKFGTVYFVTEKSTGYHFALKVIHKLEAARLGLVHSIKREILIQAQVKHPNVLCLHAWWHDESRFYLLLNLALKGDLYGALLHEKVFSEAKTARYIKQIAAGLEAIHQQGHCHRDLKPENILLDHDGVIKLADFGSAVDIPNKVRRTVCGTQDYLAPEVIEGIPQDKTVDNWSLGVLTFEFLAGYTPFCASLQAETMANIRNVRLKFPKHISPEAQDFIQSLLRKNTEERLPLPQVPKHPWIAKYDTF